MESSDTSTSSEGKNLDLPSLGDTQEEMSIETTRLKRPLDDSVEIDDVQTSLNDPSTSSRRKIRKILGNMVEEEQPYDQLMDEGD